MSNTSSGFDSSAPGWDGFVYVRKHLGNGDSYVVRYRYLAHTDKIVFASPYADESIEEIIDTHIEETVQNGVSELCVFDIHDCFSTKEAAEHSRNT